MKLSLAAMAAAFALVAAAHHAGAQEVDPGQHVRLGRQALVDDQPREAREHFKAALAALDGQSADRVAALSGLGYADLWLGYDREARDAYRQGLDLARTDEDRRAMRIGLARALISVGEPRRAHDLLQGDAGENRDAALQAAVAANDLGWNAAARRALAEAAPDGHYAGQNWQNRLYGYTDQMVGYRQSPRVSAGVQYSDDSDHNVNRTYSAAAVFPAGGLGGDAFTPAAWEARYTHVQIREPGDSVDLDTITAGASARLDADWDYALHAGVGTTNGWTFALADARLAYQPSDNWGIEVGFDRQPVLTARAVDNRILVNTFSVSGFAAITDIGTLSASYLYQDFSDGNHRSSVVLRATPRFYSLGFISASIGVQGYYRRYSSGDAPVDAYFNPRHYSAALGYVIYKQRFTPVWAIDLRAGFGGQSINGQSNAVKDFQGTLTGLVSPYFKLDLKAGYTQMASVYAAGAGYHNVYLEASLSVPF
jgi:tetratricopeptide (TPR) repeat protein